MTTDDLKAKRDQLEALMRKRLGRTPVRSDIDALSEATLDHLIAHYSVPSFIW